MSQSSNVIYFDMILNKKIVSKSRVEEVKSGNSVLVSMVNGAYFVRSKKTPYRFLPDTKFFYSLKIRIAVPEA